MNAQFRRLAATAAKFTADGYPAEAIKYWKQALQLSPENAEVLFCLGDLYRMIGDLGQAERFYIKSQQFNKDPVLPLSRLALIEERRGNVQQAKNLVNDLVQVPHPNANALAVWGSACRRLGQYADAIGVLEKALNGKRHRKELSLIHSVLAQNYEASGSYDLAFHHFAAANLKRNQQYNPSERRSQVDRLLAVPHIPPLHHKPMPLTPVLIVGFMRSGSTLLEQSLGLHSQVSTCGEHEVLGAIAQQIPAQLGFRQPWPQATAQFTPRQAENVGLLYLSEMGKAGSRQNATVIVDKALSNYQLLQLAHRILPKVKIVHCIRDPIDTCLSCFCTNFSQAHGFSTRLEWLAHEYKLYQRVMAHHQRTLDIHTVVYEDLVRQPRDVLSAVLSFIGLPWEEECMQPERNQRVAATASYAQVKQAFHTKSIGRSKRYLQHLEPLISALKG